MSIDEAMCLIGKNVYGKSRINENGIYTYKVVGVGRFLDRDYRESRDCLLLDILTNPHDLRGIIFPIGRSATNNEPVPIDELGKTYFLTKEEVFDYIQEEARRRLIPKAPDFSPVWSDYRCPTCRRSFSTVNPPKCGHCGQVLDWSDKDDKT